MNPAEVLNFINRYKRFYLIDNNTLNDGDYCNLGIPSSVKPIDSGLENHIISKINDGIYDAEALAWKSGKLNWVNDRFAYVAPFPDRCVVEGGYIKLDSNAQPISVDGFNDYLYERKQEFPIIIENYDLTCSTGRKELFLYIRDHYNLLHFGSVNIINMMFFLSKGAIPIYDRFAHAGVKALLMNKSPIEVFVTNAPNKKANKIAHTEHGNVLYYPSVSILEEYMWMLEKVFPSEIHKNGNTMYITRELDQALWVYGHAYIKHVDKHLQATKKPLPDLK